MYDDENGSWNVRTAHFVDDLPGRVYGLEATCLDLIEGEDWEQPSRVLAAHKARKLSEMAARYGFSEISSVARALYTVLNLHADDIGGLDELAHEKVRELVEVLEEMAAGLNADKYLD